MQHGENSINLQMSPTLSKSAAASNPLMPIKALDHGKQRGSNRSSTKLFSPGNHPSLHHLSSSSTSVQRHYFKPRPFIKTLLMMIIADISYTSRLHIPILIWNGRFIPWINIVVLFLKEKHSIKYFAKLNYVYQLNVIM